MKAFEIKKDVYAVGVKDWNLEEFHGYKTPRGTSYNSYLIMDEKIALIDGVKSYLSDEHISRIESVVDFSKIHYIVANHIEPDHSGNIPILMKLAPQAIILTNQMGQKNLEAYYDTAGWKFQIVKTGEEVSLGKHTIEFMTTPMLHWPDSMMTYLKEEKVLFSNDGFGQHYASHSLYARDSNIDVVAEEAKIYFANILFPYVAQAEKALKDAGSLNLDIEMIAPSHGCIWQGKEEVGKILSLYTDWAAGKNKGRAVVIYDSMWGSTAAMAETVMAEFEEQGIPVTKRNLESTHYSSVIVDLVDAEYVVIGNPTLNNQLFPRVAQFATYMRGLQPKNKKAFAFGSYGWKPGVVNQLQAIFEELGWKTVAPFEKTYRPKEQGLQALREKVRELIKA